MQIKERNGRLGFLRPIWDKEAKRTRQKTIKKEDFTPEEKRQCEEWLQQKQERITEDMYKKAAQDLPTSIENAIQGLELGAYPKQRDGRIYGLVAALQRALKKAGVARPDRPDKIPETLTGNLDL